jgi:ABC-type branched-subunit amino acid transport system substrate-binding protein
VNESDGLTPLFYAAVFSFGGDYTSIGVLPGVQIALDYINSDPSILPGYTLHYTLMDSQCKRSVALNTYYYQLNNPPTKVGWLGSGCSPATIPTAELTQYYNITQVSCVSSSPELQDRERFRYYFQLLETEVRVARGFFGIIKHYGWRKVRIIAQDESVFIAVRKTNTVTNNCGVTSTNLKERVFPGK